MGICVEGNVLEELLGLLKLEKIEENIYRGQSQDLGFGNVFGGQVLGQSLSAASRTVSQGLTAHSLHGYFMRAGDASLPIVYTVDRLRDGRSFATRQVKAVQNGLAIFSMAASFHRGEAGFSHQDPMPAVEGPEGIESEREMVKRLADSIPGGIREKLLCKKPIELRLVNPVNPFDPTPMPPVKYIWFRAIGKLPEDAAIHRYMLAYASDFHLVSTALYPHGKTFWSPDMRVASLDHAIWFHRDFRMDDWLLHVTRSPSAEGGRGLNFGAIYTRDGTLVASVGQEGMLRTLD